MSKYINRLFFMLCIIVGLILLYLDHLSPGYSGGGDTYNHYLIARFSWANPELFLDYWGKPVYTIIASLFTRLGMLGSVILNILCLLGSAIAIFYAAKNLNYKYYFLAGFIVLFSPVFLDNVISSLTEPLCAFFLASIIYLLTKKKYGYAAVIAGFLPHVRSEGLIFFGIILLFLLIKQRSIVPLLLMLIGSVGVNLLGWIYTGEPFWIITSNPYINAEMSGRSICGKGTLFHYPWQTDYTFGLFNSFMAAFSVLVIIFQFWVKKKPPNWIFILVLVLFSAFYFSHMIIWWQGMMGSCGYIRVMTIVVPLIALLIMHSVEFLLSSVAVFVKKESLAKNLVGGFIALFMIVQVRTPISYFKHRYPIQLSEEEVVFNEVAKWYKTKDFKDHAKVYLNSYFSVVGDINPFDNTKHFQLYESGIQWIKSGDIIIWDAHFCPNEGNIPKATFLEDSSYELLKTFNPRTPYTTLNDYPYEVLVFRKK